MGPTLRTLTRRSWKNSRAAQTSPKVKRLLLNHCCWVGAHSTGTSTEETHKLLLVSCKISISFLILSRMISCFFCFTLTIVLVSVWYSFCFSINRVPSTWSEQTLKDLDMLPLYLTSTFYDNFNKVRYCTNMCIWSSTCFCLVFDTFVPDLFLRTENQAKIPEVLPESSCKEWSEQEEEEEAEDRNKKVN